MVGLARSLQPLLRKRWWPCALQWRQDTRCFSREALPSMRWKQLFELWRTTLLSTQTEHVLLVGPWADDFAREMGMPLVDNGSLVSAKAKQRLEEFQCFHKTVQQSINVNQKEHDTVGAVAVDAAGHLACATSTGGLTGQRCGRVGDSPLVGAGGFADDSVCAVSTTGHGEAIARSCLAYDMAVRLQAGSSPTVAMEQALQRMRLKTQGGCAGAILVTPTGTVVTGTTTELMPWACRSKRGYQSGSQHDEHPL
uniref:Asparaginase n=1 Tax=Rhipicephalus zambeziensis TaxID=60191 RepID=A0A224YTW6_9ACAR